MLYLFYIQKTDISLDNTLNKINDKIFNTALELSGENLSYEKALKMLNSDKDVELQIAILNITEIKSTEDALLLTNKLTGQDGKIREVCAFKLRELALNPKFRQFFINEDIFKTWQNGFLDINGNICRMVVELTQIVEFKQYLAKHLPNKICEIIEEIKPMDLTSKQYLLSKKNFWLYWTLEALSNCSDFVEFDKIKDILEYCADFVDYPIREKAAKIVRNYNAKNANTIRQKLCQDENFYVRLVLKEN